MTSLASIHAKDIARIQWKDHEVEAPPRMTPVRAAEPRTEPLDPGALAFLLMAYAASVRERPAFKRHFCNKGTTVTGKIIQATCEEAGLALAELKSEQRNRRVAWPRQAAWYLMSKHTELSYPMMARKLGKSDHTTVIHGVRAVEKRVRECEEYRALVDRIAERAGLS